MSEPYYTIKEASAKVGVESHVLRYWEEELKMEIHRNQMGHRYYTEHDIELLCMVRKLKDKGLQLKAIRNYIEKRREQINNGEVPDRQHIHELEIADEYKAGGMSVEQSLDRHFEEEKNALTGVTGMIEDGYNTGDSKALVPAKPGGSIMSNADKLEQFQRIMNRIVSNAIQENNELIGRSAGEHAASAVVTSIQGMTKEQEERAEARYRKLDQTLREIQLSRKEAAAANMRPVDKRRQQRLKKKNKQKPAQETAESISDSKDEVLADITGYTSTVESDYANAECDRENGDTDATLNTTSKGKEEYLLKAEGKEKDGEEDVKPEAAAKGEEDDKPEVTAKGKEDDEFETDVKGIDDDIYEDDVKS